MRLHLRILLFVGALSFAVIAPAAVFFGYKILTDEPLHPTIPSLIAPLADHQVTTANYYIQLMSLSEQGFDPASTLLRYQQAEQGFQRDRLPILPGLDHIYDHPLWCSLESAECRELLQQHSTELELLLQSFSGLLASYQLLQTNTELTPINDQLSVNWIQLFQLQQLYALSIYQLMLQQQFIEAEQRLVDYIGQQRRLLQQPGSLLHSMQIYASLQGNMIPLVLELKKHQPGPLPKLATVLQPLSLAEVTNLPAKQGEFVSMVQLLSRVDPDIYTQSNSHKFYKPKMTLNALFLRSGIAEAAIIQSKPELYQQLHKERDAEQDGLYYPVFGFEMVRRHYRNYLGGHLVELLASSRDHSLADRIRLDSQLYLLQALLLADLTNSDELQSSDFPLNPYAGLPAQRIEHRWCYQLIWELCLDPTNAES
ncbi:hypothetical protein Q3O60_16690 [Alkalimonas collagenimarina]|uniref:Uncharacterized protein n=1 Tax=Alkalimonas collagenimarina TaxID=400390 RepID=A0ABT9H3E9_9GAMM|nr:hypothetical protein [Alkalimonas collagenimarina]MDP4537823.1 hypothetical protein [Alkalimonas collagenimarina]